MKVSRRLCELQQTTGPTVTLIHSKTTASRFSPDISHLQSFAPALHLAVRPAYRSVNMCGNDLINKTHLHTAWHADGAK